MKNKTTNTNGKITIAIVCIIGLITFVLQRFKLYTFESDYLFLYDTDWIMQNLLAPGGINLIITSFTTQFFKFPIVGATVATIIYAAILLCLKQLISNTIQTGEHFPLLLIPIGFLLMCIEESSYSFRGHTTFAICMIVTVLYQRFVSRHERFGLTAAALCTLLLYLAAGSVALLFATIVLVTDILQKRNVINGFVCICVVFICGFAFYLTGTFISTVEASLPMQYYNWPSSGLIATCAWLAVPAVVIAAKFINIQRFDYIALAVIVAGFSFGLNKMHDAKKYKMQHENYLADNGRWDNIVRLNSRNNMKTNFISYTNLALAMQGQLLDRMFEFNQQLPAPRTDSRIVRNEILRMESLVYFKSGNMAEARQAAFNSALITPGEIEPHDFLRLITINKSFDADAVSQKYADALSKTLFYKQKAATAVADSNITRLPANSNFCEIDGFAHDYRKITEANKQNIVAQQFYIAYILLSADRNRLLSYLDDHNGQPMHRRVEEACTIMFSTDECRKFGISENVINDFEKLKKGQKINDFHKTYWYYIAYLNKTMMRK